MRTGRTVVTIALVLSGCYTDQPAFQASEDSLADTLATSTKSSAPETSRGKKKRPAATTKAEPAVAAEATLLGDPASVAGGSSDSVGPLTVGERFFTIRFERENYGGRDHVRRVQIRDERGVPHYEERFDPPLRGGTPEWTTSVSAQALRGQRGQGLVLFYQRMPSPPLSGMKVRVFGLQGSQLEPIAPHLTVYGSFAELPASREPNVLFLFPDERMDVELWQGYFGMTIPLRVRLSDCTPAAQPCIRPAIRRGDIVPGLSLLHVRVPELQISSPATLTMYDAPEGLITTQVPVRRNSRVEVIEAAADIFNEMSDGVTHIRSRRDWLHVSVDGRDGWIHGEESYTAIGLSANR